MAFGMALIHAMDSAKAVNIIDEVEADSLSQITYSLNDKGNVDINGNKKNRTFKSFKEYDL